MPMINSPVKYLKNVKCYNKYKQCNEGMDRERLKSCTNLPVRLGRFRMLFNDDFEAELVMHVVEMQQ